MFTLKVVEATFQPLGKTQYLIMAIPEIMLERNDKTLSCSIAHNVWTNLTWLEVYIWISVSLLPVSDEAWRTVAGQLSVGAVAPVEAGVVPRVVAAHWNRQLGPPARKHRAGHCKALQYISLEAAAASVVLLGSRRGVREFDGCSVCEMQRISQTGAASFSFLQLPARGTERLRRATGVIRWNIFGNFSRAGCQIREEWKFNDFSSAFSLCLQRKKLPLPAT